jgi:hypothetical protein
VTFLAAGQIVTFGSRLPFCYHYPVPTMRVDPETTTVQICRYDSPHDAALAAEWATFAKGQGPEPAERPVTAVLVSLGHERWTWSPLLVTCDDPDYPAVADLKIVVPPGDGRPRAVDVTVRSRDGVGDVDAETLRIPVAALIRYAIDLQADHGPDAPPGALPGAGHVGIIGATVEPVKLPRRRHVARTKERLERVVEIYNATPWGERADAVAKDQDVSPNTARNLISEARRRGLFASDTEHEENDR